MAWRQLRRGAAPTNVPPPGTPVERFVYVVSGAADLTVSAHVQRVMAGTLIVIPSGEQQVRMQATGAIDAVLVEFSPERR